MNKTKKNYNIDYQWDEEAKVWIVTSEDVPGLVLESDSRDDLTGTVRDVVLELVKLNGSLEKE